LIWHVALLCGFGLAVAANLFWLSDWLEYWWIRAPVRIESDVLSHRTLRTLWEAEATLWGSAADRTLAVALFAVAAVGVLIWNFQRERASARLMGLGAAGLLGLSVFGVTSEPLGSVGAVRLLIPALLFAVVPAVYGLVWLLRNLLMWSGSPWRSGVVLAGVLLMVLVPFRQSLAALALRCTGTNPFVLGLGPEREAVVAALCRHTNQDGRILWEDRPGTSATEHWTALLPILTDRAYLGGLDSNAGIEHEEKLRFADQQLAGCFLRDWSDVELEAFFRRYNVGWVVCWSGESIDRLRKCEGIEPVETLQDCGTGCLFKVNRIKSYVLKGEARWIQADSRRIALGDVAPEMTADGGELWLSLHHQTGMRAAPDHVKIEKVQVDPKDLPFVRLRLSGPVSRVVLTWENR
jgi:hypothetical protein